MMANQTTNPSQLTPETLEFIYEATKDAPERQIAAGAALDAKIVQILATASVVMGLTGLSMTLRIGSRWATLLLFFALIAYGAVVLCTVLQMIPKQFRESRAADQLWPEHWHEPVFAIQHDLVEDIVNAYIENAKLLKRKAGTLRFGLAALSIEVGFAVGALLAVRLAF